MSRSYHVTERQARRAFNNGDAEPMYMASEKSSVKRRQKKVRVSAAVHKKVPNNRAIVTEEKKRTKRARGAIEQRASDGSTLAR